MIKKTLAILSLAMCALTTVSTHAADWYKYPIFCDRIDDVVETSTTVFYLSDSNLFSFCPADNESFAYTHLNKLNSVHVDKMYYNPEKKYLLLVYDDFNIDLITDSGKIINLPEIKNSSVNYSKNINDVAFGEDRIAIATNFGIVVYDDTKYEVVESGIYNKIINNVAIMDGHLLIYGHYATNFTIMASPLGAHHNRLDKFTKLFSYAIRDMKPVGANLLLCKENNTNKLFMRRVNFDTMTVDKIEVADDYAYDYDLKVNKNGVYTLSDDKIVVCEDGQLVPYPLPENMRGEKIGFYDSPEEIWVGYSDGIAHYSLAGGGITVLHDKMLHNNYITTNRVGYMIWSKDKKRLYLSNYEVSNERNYALGEGSTNYQTTNYLENGDATDVSIMEATATHHYSTKYQQDFNSTRMYGDPTMVLQDPDDPDKYYCGNYFEGLYVIKKNPQTGKYEQIWLFNQNNAPFVDNWGTRVMFVDTDKDGNLWVGHQFGHLFSVLPADKRRQDPATLTKDDWIIHPYLEDLQYHAKDFLGVICKKSNMIIFSMGSYKNGFVALDTKGTYLDLKDDAVYKWIKMIDQDGNEVSYGLYTCFIEDQRGCVWVGTNAGVFEITKPANATDPNMRIRRIKVPRNDGTNYADYLLDSDMINWMAVDPSGRKWIATETSGLFLVSETGDRIIEHYDTSNSPLMSNLVTSVECDQTDNTVYVGTTNGLYTFKGTASPGQDDYSGIYAYPNPVRPEYSGMVTITGLMDNTIVKITDTAGCVVYETTSQGGMATWDACNMGGERVPSGVYYVYASHYDGNASKGAVTKILVIN